MTTRVHPPAGGAVTTLFDVTYRGIPGTPLDVPDNVAWILMANDWTAVGTVNTTALRPTAPYKGQTFMDTTLGYLIHYDGKTWRNPAGTAV